MCCDGNDDGKDDNSKFIPKMLKFNNNRTMSNNNYYALWHELIKVNSGTGECC